ncbi:MAG: Unknown protein [uncultured Thiotrichaceae bacterium]|uniref:Uncharacterized protein n=1 Tax=uncultured Thiotrichaceae bacterium TaxID=298394 RepID=A0A6S6TMC3_9GAMM|nr:MAG: Unknown protein [uncultured Thiotrichaceae bacterium]
MKIKVLLGSILLGIGIPMANADEPRAPSAAEIIVQEEQAYTEKLAILKTRNPEKDAAAANAMGFAYVLGYYRGRSMVVDVPGVDKIQYAEKKSVCPTLVMGGMGDMIYGAKHQEYRKALLDYAKRFNQKTFAVCSKK